MKVRLILLSVFTFFLGFLAAMHAAVNNQYDPFTLNFWFILFLLGLTIIGVSIWNHKTFSLDFNTIKIDQPIQGQTKYDLKQLIEWQETCYNIRGRKRKSLILFFEFDQSLRLTNVDLEREYKLFQII
ncbi:MAG TPA: hypothetical protein DGG95_04100 [Cytophagales bacterium]|jgi:hypothetical protein|nr:hypothetical protein [Cytophagales bacterium]